MGCQRRIRGTEGEKEEEMLRMSHQGSDREGDRGYVRVIHRNLESVGRPKNRAVPHGSANTVDDGRRSQTESNRKDSE